MIWPRAHLHTIPVIVILVLLHWIDDDTLDDTGNNPECAGYNGTYDALGCKFGLYVSNKVDITIRFDDLKALEGSPSGAFNIVKPGN